MKSIASAEVRIDDELRAIVGRAFVAHLKSVNVQIVAFAVGKVHAHGLIELTDNLPAIRKLIGDAKR